MPSAMIYRANWPWPWRAQLPIEAYMSRCLEDRKAIQFLRQLRGGDIYATDRNARDATFPTHELYHQTLQTRHDRKSFLGRRCSDALEQRLSPDSPDRIFSISQNITSVSPDRSFAQGVDCRRAIFEPIGHTAPENRTLVEKPDPNLALDVAQVFRAPPRIARLSAKLWLAISFWHRAKRPSA